MPPQREVIDLWNQCGSVLDDSAALAWLTKHGIDPVRVDAERLALVLPEVCRLPSWATSKIGKHVKTWAQSGHRLILPLVDTAGALRSVLARDLTDTHREKKSLPPSGFARKGLFLRDTAARVALWPEQSRDTVPELASALWFEDAPEPKIVVLEGEKKFLLHATIASDADAHAPATIGIMSGSWSDELAALIPDGFHLGIETDPDGKPEGTGASGGALYATKILRSVEDRVRTGTIVLELGEHFIIDHGRYGLVVRVLSEASA